MNDLKECFEYTQLSSIATEQDIIAFCEEARQNQYTYIVVSPYYQGLVNRWRLENEEENIKLVTVIGFPYGYNPYKTKFDEFKFAIDEGIDELDVVLNHQAIKSKDRNYIEREIEGVVNMGRLRRKIVKIILDTPLFTLQEMEALLPVFEKHDIDFLKTGTGVNGPTNVETVKFLRENLNPRIKIKASGGIRTREEVEMFVSAGANRIGSSSPIKF